MVAVKGGGIHVIGRRKSAVARVFMREGSGNIAVNGQPCNEYFGREALSMIAMQPLVLTEKVESFDIKLTLNGGGKGGQAGAARHGLARALAEWGEGELRPVLKKAGYLTRDSREVERKKYGRHKARKKPQYSKR